LNRDLRRAFGFERALIRAIISVPRPVNVIVRTNSSSTYFSLPGFM
jgi:hypothetical protein